MIYTKRPSAARLRGLDVARGVAIIGMVIVNGSVTANLEGFEAVVVRLLHGRAAILFIVLAGIGVTLLTRSITAKGAPLWPTLLWRAGLLLILGLGLQLLPTGANVILTLYAGLFLAAGVLLQLSHRWLAGGAVFAALIGPVVYIVLGSRTNLPTAPAAFGHNPVEIAASVVFTGPYPLVVWIAPFLFGMWLGKFDLRTPRIQWMLMIIGVIAAAGAVLLSRALRWAFGEPDPDVLSFDHLLLTSGHSQMPLWLISAAGSSAAIIGLALMLTPKIGAAAHPLAATGQLALTCYCLHLAAIAVVVGLESATPQKSLYVSFLIIVGLVVFSTVWRAIATRGPLEALLRLPPLLKNP